MIDIYDIRNVFSEMNEETKRLVLSSPEIDAEPVRHGYWIYYNKNGWRVCSHCNDRRRTLTLDNYCPKCGAKMDAVYETTPRVCMVKR